MLFSAALESDPSLIEAGVAQRVIPASPTTLIALLRAVSYGWKQQAITIEAQQISELGGLLYKRLVVMAEHFFQLGRSLKASVESYNNAIGSLETRVLVSARKLKDYDSVTTEKDLKNMEPVEPSPRSLQAPEMTSVPDGLFPLPESHVPEDDDDDITDSRPAIADLSSGSPTPVLAETKTPASPKSRLEPS
jgi:DNA recombination protein RmuC